MRAGLHPLLGPVSEEPELDAQQPVERRVAVRVEARLPRGDLLHHDPRLRDPRPPLRDLRRLVEARLAREAARDDVNRRLRRHHAAADADVNRIDTEEPGSLENGRPRARPRPLERHPAEPQTAAGDPAVQDDERRARLEPADVNTNLRVWI